MNKYFGALLFALALGTPLASTAAPCSPGELCLTKTVDNSSPQVGDTVTFTLTANNDKATAESDIEVTDQLTSGFTYVSSSASAGSYDPVSGVWAVGTMPASSTETLAITATVKGTEAPFRSSALAVGEARPAGIFPGPALDYSNTAALVNPHDPADNNADSVTVAPTSADLQGFVGGSGTPDLGDPYTLTVEVVNHGPAAATGVSLAHVLDVGFTYVSSSATAGSYDAGTGIWTVGAVAAYSVQTLTVVVNTNAMGPHRSSVTVTGDQHDPDLANNADSMVVYPGPSDLSVTKTVNNPTPLVGEVVTFTITASNAGPGLAPVASVNDPLPAGYTYVSSSASKGSYDPISGSWSLGSMLPYTTETLALSATVLPVGPFRNTASVGDRTIFRDGFEDSAPLPVDPGTAASVDVFPTSTGLSVTKTVDNPTAQVGSVVTFTITASNAGPGNATGVFVTDQLASGFTYVSSSASAGAFDPGTGIWAVGPLAAFDSQTLTLAATVNQTGPYTNSVTIRGDQHDYDPTDNEDDTEVVPESAYLSVTKTVDNPTAQVGSVVTFTITASNAGPADATGVVATDQLQAGFTYVSSSATVGSYDPGTGLWTIGNLANGATQTLTIAATVNQTGPYTNSVTVSGNEHNPNPNNPPEIIVTPTQPPRAAPVMVPANHPAALVLLLVGVLALVGTRFQKD